MERTSRDPINVKLVGVDEDVKYRRLKRLFGELSKATVKEKAWRTVHLVRVRPPVFSLERRSGKAVDERGFDDKLHVYIAFKKPWWSSVCPHS